MKALPDIPPALAAAALALALPLAVLFITIPLDEYSQLIVACAGFVLVFLLNRRGGRAISLFLMSVSALVSLRYLYWRYAETYSPESIAQLVLMTGLLLAETYAVLFLVLSYFQTAWPLDRKPVPLPDDPATWPTVDVFIPTYNESLDVVRPTVLAALALDWPEDKLNVWILDDGRRPEFQAFADEVGAGYIVRPDNKGAKAGNINHALKHTSGEVVAIFDCDHVPTRAFLQLTVGWLAKDPTIGLVQVPHYFYSPDPFQRNLSRGHEVPEEGLMFYGLVQPGNDLWNAAFFCGSCAVIRRSALESIGGVPTETVTEDAHCSLRMQRRGWSTAYLAAPLAAGLATERLALHLGQRMRWARGMIQILRMDNPFFGKGLTVPQRLCYFAAMISWMFPLPRIVFLTAPLAFLLFQIPVIAASPLAIVAYAAPHIVHAVATSSRLAGRVRHSFWSEVYETVLAFYLTPVVVATFLDPKKGKFNVTDKGGRLEAGYLDIRAVWPNLVLLGLLIAGLIAGIVGLIVHEVSSLAWQAYLLNAVWAFFCLFPVMASIAVGRERQQQRTTARVPASIAAELEIGNLRLPCRTADLSLAGVRLVLSAEGTAHGAERLEQALARGETEASLRLDPGVGPMVLPLALNSIQVPVVTARFRPRTAEEMGRVVQAVLGRADAWLRWNAHEPDRPFRSLFRVAQSIGGVFARTRKRGRRSAVVPPPVVPAMPPSEPSATLQPPAGTKVLPPRRLRAAAAAMALAVLPAWPSAAQPTASSPVAGEPTQTAPAAGDVRDVVRTFRQLGLAGPMTLRGTNDLQGIVFGVRADEVVLSASLELSGSWSPALIPALSQVRITLNEEVVAALRPEPGALDFNGLSLPIPSTFFSEINRLNFRFSGRYTHDCNDPLSGLLWMTISDRSVLRLRVARLAMPPDLSRLPEPFFDPRDLRGGLELPVVFRSGAVTAPLIRAGVLSTSWFAVQADFRQARFPVRRTFPASGNALLIVASEQGVPELGIEAFDGPTLAVRRNPFDPVGQILVIGGRTAAEAATAALGLAVGARGLSGETARVEQIALARRRPYDAPKWIPRDRPVRFGELVDVGSLQGTGFVPVPIEVPLRTSPDLWLPPGRALKASVRIRVPPNPVADLSFSRMDAFVSDVFLQTVRLGDPEPWWPLRPLARALGAMPTGVRHVDIDIPPITLSGRNALRFAFDLRPFNRGDCVAVPEDLKVAVLPDSTIDLSPAQPFALLPNLAFFANAGFPFTRLADLSETALLVPPDPNDEELRTIFEVLGHISALVGHPPTGIEVTSSTNLGTVADKDLIVVGSPSRQPGLAALLANASLRMDQNLIALSVPASGFALRELVFGPRERADRDRASLMLSAPGEGIGIIHSFESPLSRSRVVVMLAATTAEAYAHVRNVLLDPELASEVQGDLVLTTSTRREGFRVGPMFERGELAWYYWPRYMFGDHPLALLTFALGAALLTTVGAYALLRRLARRRLSGATS